MREQKQSVAYYRVSTQRQGASGLGLEAQKLAVCDYCKRSGLEIIAEYTEIESGKNNARVEIAKAINEAKARKAILVIAKLDRLARNVNFISGLTDSRIEFAACDMPEANELTIHIVAAMAQHEAKMISARTKAALTAAKARGKILGSPQNLTDESRKLAAISKRNKAQNAYKKVSGYVAELRNRGLSLAKIAERLNSEGHLTRNGCLFNAKTVLRMLKYSMRETCRVPSVGEYPRLQEEAL